MVLHPSCATPACPPTPYCLPPVPFVPSCYLPSLCYPPPCPAVPPPQIYCPTTCTPQQCTPQCSPCPPPPPSCCPSPSKPCCPRPPTCCQNQCRPKSGCCGGGGCGGTRNNNCNNCCSGPKPIVCVPIRVQAQACLQMGCGGNRANCNQRKRKRRRLESAGGMQNDKQQASYNNCNFYMTGIPKELCDKFGLGFRDSEENGTTEDSPDETSEDLTSGRDDLDDDEYEDCVADENINEIGFGESEDGNWKKCLAQAQAQQMMCCNPWAAFFPGLMANCCPGGFPFGMCGMGGPGKMGNGGRGRGFGRGMGGRGRGGGPFAGRGRGIEGPLGGGNGGFNGNGLRGGRGGDPNARGVGFNDGRGGRGLNDGRGGGGLNDGRGGAGLTDGRGGGGLNDGRGGAGLIDGRGGGFNDGRGGDYGDGYGGGRNNITDNKSSQRFKKGATSRIFSKMSGYRPYPYSNAELTKKSEAYLPDSNDKSRRSTKNTSKCSTVAAVSSKKINARSSKAELSQSLMLGGGTNKSAGASSKALTRARSEPSMRSMRGGSQNNEGTGHWTGGSKYNESTGHWTGGSKYNESTGHWTGGSKYNEGTGHWTGGLQDNEGTGHRTGGSQDNEGNENVVPVYRTTTQTRLQIIERPNEPSEIRVIQQPVQEVVSYQKAGPPDVENSRINLNIVTEDNGNVQPPENQPKRGKKRSHDPCRPRQCMQYHTRRLHRLCSFSNRRKRRLSQIHKPLFALKQPPCPIRETVGSILRKWPPARCRQHMAKKVPPFHEYCATDLCPDVNRYPLLTRELSPLCHEYYADKENKEGALEDNHNQDNNEHQNNNNGASKAQASHPHRNQKRRGVKRKRESC